jgi:hypothetical protein
VRIRSEKQKLKNVKFGQKRSTCKVAYEEEAWLSKILVTLKKKSSWALRYKPVIPALGSLRQENHEFKQGQSRLHSEFQASVGYIEFKTKLGK